MGELEGLEELQAMEVLQAMELLALMLHGVGAEKGWRNIASPPRPSCLQK
jgi:hypothetical protein